MGRAGRIAVAAICACVLGLQPVTGTGALMRADRLSLEELILRAARAGRPATEAEPDGEDKAALEQLVALYEEYEARFAAIEHVSEIEENGFAVIEEQSFPVILETFGEEEVTFLPVMEEEYSRMGVLIADSVGDILYRTNQLETNNRRLGELEQSTKGIAAVSFQDLNRDGLTDIILITDCESEAGEYYKTGDVLFQKDGGFYRDWRISDKLNRFNMNKSVDFIVACVRYGASVEVLYTATTLDELLDSGFQIMEEQCYWRSFEKQGRLQVVPGVIKMAEYNIFMIYLVNSQGYIVFSLQTMDDYDNLYALKGMTCKDIDGDGMKDILVLARYSYSDAEGNLLIDTVCSVFYQRTDGFVEEKSFRCTPEDTVSGLVELIRGYWGWTVDND